MHDYVFKHLFGVNKDQISLKEINAQIGEKGEEIKTFTFKQVEEKNYNTIHMTSNGFSLSIQNKNEVEETKDGEKKIIIDNPKARYSLINPQWNFEKKDLTYEKGLKLLKETAEQYQSDMLAQFNGQNRAE